MIEKLYTEIKALIEKLVSAYKRWKRFRTDCLKALHIYHIIHCWAVTMHIKIAKIRKFSSAMNNKCKWNVIREIEVGGKCPETDFCVDVNKLNDQFVHFTVPTSIGNFYDDICCVPLQYSFSFRNVD